MCVFIETSLVCPDMVICIREEECADTANDNDSRIVADAFPVSSCVTSGKEDTRS